MLSLLTPDGLDSKRGSARSQERCAVVHGRGNDWAQRPTRARSTTGTFVHIPQRSSVKAPMHAAGRPLYATSSIQFLSLLRRASQATKNHGDLGGQPTTAYS